MCRASTDPDFGQLHAARGTPYARIGAFLEPLSLHVIARSSGRRSVSLARGHDSASALAGAARRLDAAGRRFAAAATRPPSARPPPLASLSTLGARLGAPNLRHHTDSRTAAAASYLPNLPPQSHQSAVRCGEPLRGKGIFIATHSSSLEPPLRHNNFTIAFCKRALDSDSRGVH